MKNQQTVLFDTSIGSFNMGDSIIVKSFLKNGSDVLRSGVYAKFSTHTPNFEPWQMTKLNDRYRFVSQAARKFIVGTNLLSMNLLRPWPNFNLTAFNRKVFKNCVLVGVGAGQGETFNAYTKWLYSTTFSRQYTHSTRDERTAILLRELGFEAINTGCPTMWGLTKQFCKDIPETKAEAVVFTLTNDSPDEERDKKMISILKSVYKQIFFYPQSFGDLEYLNQIDKFHEIEILPSDIDELSRFYNNNDVDYIGTRLHGGIYAMQHKKRSIVVGIDNRAADIKNTYNINYISRQDLPNELQEIIMSSFKTELNIDEQKINMWKNQFQ